MRIDLNHDSGFVYGGGSVHPAAARINQLIDAALTVERRSLPPRDYLGASRIGEPCSRRLVYEFTGTPPDEGKDFDGHMLRIFEAGHVFEALSIRWLRAAGFDLRTAKADGSQFGFSVGGRQVPRPHRRRHRRWARHRHHLACTLGTQGAETPSPGTIS